MPRGYRCIVLAAFGCLALCGASPAKQAESGYSGLKAAVAPQAVSPPTPAPPTGPSPKFTAYPGYNPDPCYKAENHDAADLCAQWRAAIAAEKAAHEARRASTWSIVATLLSALSLLAVAVALYLTIEANNISRDIGKRQLRAYISIEPGGINEVQEGKCRAPIHLVNSGQTPAYDIELFGDFLVISGDPREFDPANQGRFTGEMVSTQISLPANGGQWTYAYLPEDIPKPYWSQIAAKEMAIIHYGRLRYRDIFEQPWETQFAFYYWGAELSDAETKRCRFGNHAT